MSQLTQKQQQIYDYILSYTDTHGYPPSVREIAEAVDLKSPSTVHFHLKGLRSAGLISQASLYILQRSVCVCVCVCLQVARSCPTLCNPMDYIARQDPLSREFSRQEYWRGLPLPSPGRSS